MLSGALNLLYIEYRVSSRDFQNGADFEEDVGPEQEPILLLEELLDVIIFVLADSCSLRIY